MDYLYLNDDNKKELLHRQILQCEADHYDSDLAMRRMKHLEQTGQPLNDLITHIGLLENTQAFLKTELASFNS